MKKAITILGFIMSCFIVFGQSPQAFKYQTIIRDISGDVLANQNVGLQISILEGSDTGTPVYVETWNLTSNQFGLITLNVGEGTSSDDFTLIDWGTNSYWLKIALDENGGTNYSDMGASQLLSVPYALYSNTSANGTNQWLNSGSDIYFNSGNVGIGTGTPSKKLVIKAENDTDTLMEIQDMDGNPLMIITPKLTKFNFIEGTKGVSGGFAVGRYATAKGGKAYSDTALLVITPDSARIYTSGTPGKGVSGGFAVGRYATAKGNKSYVKKYFFTGIDSTRVYTDGNGTKGVSGGFAVGRYATAKGIKKYNFYTNIDSTRINTGGLAKGVSGGFAVGRYATAKGSAENYMYMVPENYFIGHQAGDSLQNSTYTGKYNLFCGFESGLSDTSGSYNSFFGYQSGYRNISGKNNVFTGYNTGKNHISGDNNVYIGNEAGSGSLSEDETGINNVFIGTESGTNNTTGIYNTFLGYRTGYQNTTGGHNIFLGYQSGLNNTTGWTNIYIGSWAGMDNQTGSDNVYIGGASGRDNTHGLRNTYLGFYTGATATGTDNVFIGYEAGKNELGSNKLFIDNNETSTPLIYGDFSSDFIRIHGSATIGQNPLTTSTGYKFRVFADNYRYFNGFFWYGGYAASIYNDGNNTNRRGLEIHTGTDDGSGTNYQIVFNDGDGGYQGAITSSGGTVSYGAKSAKSSQKSLKMYNDNASFLINKISIVKFKANKDSENSVTGFNGEELIKLFPESTFYDKEEDAYITDKSSLVPILVKAIQEQNKKIQDLEQQIQELKDLIQNK